MKMLDTTIIEQIRRYGEMNEMLKRNDNEFIKWVMRIGESRNILNNALIKFSEISDTMRELEKNIPGFHKQPGLFREFENQIQMITNVISHVNQRLSYVQEKEDPIVCTKCQDEIEDDFNDSNEDD